jgi:hypothetical protein
MKNVVRFGTIIALVLSSLVACTGGAAVIAGPSEEAATICAKATDYCNGPTSDFDACNENLSKVPACLPKARAFVDCLVSKGATCDSRGIDEDLPACAAAESAFKDCARQTSSSASPDAG